MDRVQQSTTAYITATFTVDAVATDPSPKTATVTITRANGTALVSTAATTHASIGVFRYQLTTTHTALLDNLTARWTSSLGTITTEIEIVGGFLFSLAALRAKLTDTSTYPTADLIEARTWAEAQIEQACGVAFVPRYARRTLGGEGGIVLELPDNKVRSVRAVTTRASDGAATIWTNADIANLIIDSPFVVRRWSLWDSGSANVDIEYEHGLSATPTAVSNATLDLALYRLQSKSGAATSIDPRATSISSQDGTLSLATAGVGPGGAVTFGLPEVDAVVAGYTKNWGIF